MEALATERVVAKKKVNPPRNDEAVRLRSDVAAKARIAASYEGESITDLLSNLLDPLLTKLINDGHARISKMSTGTKGKRPDASE